MNLGECPLVFRHVCQMCGPEMYFHFISFQADSEEEDEVFNANMESVELYCVHVREKLTNSIRFQWRRLKSHVERLDSQGSWDLWLWLWLV